MILPNGFLLTVRFDVSIVETGYKNIFGSRKNVLIKGKINLGTYRNVSSENVLITGMFL